MSDFPKDPNTLAWLRVAAYAIFAAVGGVLGYVMHTLEHGRPIDWRLFTFKGASSAFVGILVMFVCHHFHLSLQETGALVGLAGWAGADATIKVIRVLLFKFLGIKSGDLQDEKNQ